MTDPLKYRFEALKQYVGGHYSGGGADKRVPVNFLEQAITIYVQHLAARAPRVMVSTGVDQLKPFARSMQLALNQIPKEINLGQTLQDAVIEAMFGIGVVKVGICTSGHTQLGHDVGEPFVDVVSPDDYFLDMTAKKYGSIQFEGNDYWLDLESARELNEGSESVEPDKHTVHGDQGERRAEQITTNEGAEEYRERVWLRDVWLPDSQTIHTYGVKTKNLLRIVDWDGPDRGPYHSLRYTTVPGNLMPLPPASLWIDIHEISNSLFRKLSKQAIAKKTIIAFQGGDDAEANRLKTASDGEGIVFAGPEPKPIVVGGIDAQSMAFFLQSKDLFNHITGNLDALGGLGPQTETASQDRAITAAAGARMDRYKAKTIEFAGGVFEALAWYDWTDPFSERPVEKEIEGTDIVAHSVWSEETRDGDFLDYNLEIDPYSMEQDTPEARLQKIGMIFERFVLPMLPMLQQQGGHIDVQKLLALVGKLSNVDEIRELVVFAEPTPGVPQQGGSPEPSFKPANTTRTYVRTNRPGATRHGKDDAMARLLMGANVQDAEAAAIGRPVS